jgi:2-amino-4-hydroxy-6-hydroxymethyldihydropteridine diphosphokinase
MKERKKMKKKITNELSLFFSNLFPLKNQGVSKKKNFIVIGIGGNVGDTKKIFQKLLLQLSHHKQFDVVQTSPLLQNPPFGFLDQKEFLNGIIVLKSNMSAKESLKIFQRLEKRYKRKRSFKDAPRTLDIDIIFVNKEKIKSKNLIIPHPNYHERVSVLIPLGFVLSV